MFIFFTCLYVCEASKYCDTIETTLYTKIEVYFFVIILFLLSQRKFDLQHTIIYMHDKHMKDNNFSSITYLLQF